MSASRSARAGLVAATAAAVAIGLVSAPPDVVAGQPGARVEIRAVQIEAITLTAAGSILPSAASRPSADATVDDMGVRIGNAFRAVAKVVLSPVIVPAVLLAGLFTLGCIGTGRGCDNGGPIDTYIRTVSAVLKLLEPVPLPAEATSRPTAAAQSASVSDVKAPIAARKSVVGSARPARVAGSAQGSQFEAVHMDTHSAPSARKATKSSGSHPGRAGSARKASGS
ncbi:hypothetical protein ACTXG7_26725 [Mycolicibacterium sp. Dal123E01]|uniref:hypothetical protein n=1 Tax=Mycolicibacterium sp. Dal123E01 TaxID=3457578 RepID=UPI00403EBFE9